MGKNASASSEPEMENSRVPEGSEASMVSVFQSRLPVEALTDHSPVEEETEGKEPGLQYDRRRRRCWFS
jgi:hypothetical protein